MLKSQRYMTPAGGAGEGAAGEGGAGVGDLGAGDGTGGGGVLPPHLWEPQSHVDSHFV